MYTRGESKELFDVVQQLLRGVTGNGETRGAMFDREKEWRVASCKVLGEVMGAKGQQVSRQPPLCMVQRKSGSLMRAHDSSLRS